MPYAADARVPEFQAISLKETYPGMMVRIEYRGPRGGSLVAIGKITGFFATTVQVDPTNTRRHFDPILVPIRRITKVEGILG